MSTRKQRSRAGCWTCKDRRRKCDGKRPFCRNCEEREIQCEGYEVRLQWGVGVASRGRFTGAEKPVVGSVPTRPAGRRRDRERQKHQRVTAGLPAQHPEFTNDSINIDDDDLWNDNVIGTAGDQVHDPELISQLSEAVSNDEIFEQFLTSGIHVLHSTAVNDTEQMLAPRLPALCMQSKALYSVCLAFQTSVSEALRPLFPEYFDAALTAFRTELDACVSYLEDATWAAGLLLCSVGFFYGIPWTIHLQGMYAILKAHGFDDNPGQPNPFRAHLLEVMGVMDLPSFAVGRKTPCIGIWRHHCRENMFYHRLDRNTIEHVSGLPRSLLDIFSSIGEGSREQDFWDWPGCKGTFLQCQLWEAYRLAGILTLRQPRTFSPAPTSTNATRPLATIGGVSSSTEILVARILSHVQAIVKISESQETDENELVINAINYPTFVAASEVSTINANEDWKDFIVSCFTSSRLVKSHGMENGYLLELLRNRWQLGIEAPMVDELARSRDRELGLL